MQIFKDPNDMLTGRRTGGPKRKQYDLEGVKDAHLYYDHKVDRKLDQKRRKAITKVLRREPELEDSSYEAILSDLKNHQLVERASGKIFLRVAQLEEQHKDKLEELKPYLSSYFGKLCKNHVHKFSRRELTLLLVYSRKYRTEMPKEEFLSLLHYISGIIGSDSYNDKSLVEEERDEERLSTYIDELSFIYRNNVSDKVPIRLETEKVFLQLKNDIIPHASKFRKPTNLFRTMAGLGHLVALPQEVVDLVKAKPVELKGLGSLSDFVSIIKGTSIKDNLKNYQAYLGKLSRMTDVSKYSGLHSFLLAVNQSPDAELISKELSDIFKKLEPSLNSLPFATVLQMAQISAKLNNGKISEPLRQALDSRAKEEVTYLDRDGFYQYFSLARYTGAVSKDVINSFVERKTKNRDLELKPSWVEELLTVYRELPKRSESVDLLVAEFEADLAHLRFQLNHPLHMTAATKRLNN